MDPGHSPHTKSTPNQRFIYCKRDDRFSYVDLKNLQFIYFLVNNVNRLLPQGELLVVKQRSVDTPFLGAQTRHKTHNAREKLRKFLNSGNFLSVRDRMFEANVMSSNLSVNQLDPSYGMYKSSCPLLRSFNTKAPFTQHVRS